MNGLGGVGGRPEKEPEGEPSERGDEPLELDPAAFEGPARRSILKKSSKEEFRLKPDCKGLSTSIRKVSAMGRQGCGWNQVCGLRRWWTLKER